MAPTLSGSVSKMSKSKLSWLVSVISTLTVGAPNSKVVAERVSVIVCCPSPSSKS